MPRSSSRPRYQLLADEISEVIYSGRLPPGSLLPSIRECSRQRELSINTVLAAYRLIEDRGLIKSVPQSGFQVISQLAELDHPLQAGGSFSNTDGDKDLLGVLLEAQSQAGILDLAFAAPRGGRFFPGRALSALTRQVLRDQNLILTTYALNCPWFPRHSPSPSFWN